MCVYSKQDELKIQYKRQIYKINKLNAHKFYIILYFFFL